MDIRTDQTIAWDAVDGADSYEVELSQLNGTVDASLTVVDTDITVAELFEGLALGVTRRVRVRAVDEFGPGAWSAFLSPLTLVGLLAPLNLRIEG